MITNNKNQLDVEDYDHDSFINVESKLNNKKYAFNGFMTLKSAEIRKSENIPIDNQKLSYDKYIIFKTDTSSEDADIIIVPPHDTDNEHKFILEWAEVDSVGELVNKQVPVDNIKDNIYKPSDKLRYINIDNKKDMNKLINDGFLKYDKEKKKWIRDSSYQTLMSAGVVTTTTLSLIISIGITYVIPVQSAFINGVSIFILTVFITIFILLIEDKIEFIGNTVYKIAKSIAK